MDSSCFSSVLLVTCVIDSGGSRIVEMGERVDVSDDKPHPIPVPLVVG